MVIELFLEVAMDLTKRFNQKFESNRDFFDSSVWPSHFFYSRCLTLDLGWARFYDARSCKGSSKSSYWRQPEYIIRDEWLASSTRGCQSVCRWKIITYSIRPEDEILSYDRSNRGPFCEPWPLYWNREMWCSYQHLLILVTNLLLNWWGLVSSKSIRLIIALSSAQRF